MPVKAYLLSDHLELPVNHTIVLQNTIEQAVAALGAEIVQKFSDTTALIRIPKATVGQLNIPTLNYRALVYDISRDHLEQLILSEYPMVGTTKNAGYWFSAYQQQVLA